MSTRDEKLRFIIKMARQWVAAGRSEWSEWKADTVQKLLSDALLLLEELEEALKAEALTAFDRAALGSRLDKLDSRLDKLDRRLEAVERKADIL